MTLLILQKSTLMHSIRLILSISSTSCIMSWALGSFCLPVQSCFDNALHLRSQFFTETVRLRDDCFGDTFSPMIAVSSSCVIYLGVIWCFLVKGHHMRVGIHGAFGHSFFLLSFLFGQLLSVVRLLRLIRPLSLYLSASVPPIPPILSRYAIPPITQLRLLALSV
jgi:hypothetical protein